MLAKLGNKLKLLDLYVNEKDYTDLILENNKFVSRKIIKRKRIYLLCETQKERTPDGSSFYERTLVNEVRKNKKYEKYEKCQRCKKYINIHNKINIRNIKIKLKDRIEETYSTFTDC